MTFTTWLLGRQARRNRRSISRSKNHLGMSRRFGVECLEDRSMLSTVTVENLNDSGPGSLRAALAAQPDTINFAPHLHGTIKLTSGELSVTNSVTINGPGANAISVSGNNASRVFEIVGSQNVTIGGLTITAGYAAEQGGGILNDGSNLTLNGDDLSYNVAFEDVATEGANEQVFGGALDSLAGKLSINGCQISDNQSLGATGAVAHGSALGGGVAIQGGNGAISGSTVSGNLARGGANSTGGPVPGVAAGGGIYSAVAVTVGDTVINDNVSRGGDNGPFGYGLGGGIALDFGSSGTISGSSFSGNQATGGNGGTGPYIGEASGGAILSEGTLSVSSTAFDGNQALGGSGANSGVSDASPFVDYAFGGAVSVQFASASVTGSVFSHNQAVGGNNAVADDPSDIVGVGGAEGGAFYSEVGTTAAVSQTEFDHNQAVGGNGNIGIGAVVLAGEGLGGAIVSGYGSNFVGPATLNVTDSTITQNKAQGGDNNAATASFSALVGSGAGAGIANYTGSSTTVSDSELDHGQARGGRNNSVAGSGSNFAGLGVGGGIVNYLGGFNSPIYGQFPVSTLTVSDSTIDHNLAQGGGGGNGEGGGIADLVDAATTVDSSSVTQNQANGDGGGAGLGGGLYNDATSSLTLTGASVTQNHANGSPGIGGGVYNLGTFIVDPTTVIAGNHASTEDDNIGP